MSDHLLVRSCSLDLSVVHFVIGIFVISFIAVVCHLGFGGSFILIVHVSGHCLHSTLLKLFVSSLGLVRRTCISARTRTARADACLFKNAGCRIVECLSDFVIKTVSCTVNLAQK